MLDHTFCENATIHSVKNMGVNSKPVVKVESTLTIFSNVSSLAFIQELYF